jgi:superfamily II DNA or RNA helicase
MTRYNKRKGIVYVNTRANAKKLHKLMKTQNIIKSYIYISKDIDTDVDIEQSITDFENDLNKCIVIAVGKISYGYDNDFIDFICLGDPRQSPIDIRQIIGRGLRWNKKTYPNKLLHLLIPLYKDEFDNYSDNETLKNYLDYIIGECGQDIIIKNNSEYGISKNNNNVDGKNYDGSNIPIEILQDYCTNRYNMYSDFMRFLKINNIFDEKSYNQIKRDHDWFKDLGNIFSKYPKFNFKSIHPDNKIYYNLKKDAKQAFDNSNNQLMDILGKEKYKKLNSQQKLDKINELDNKIPNIKLDLYYGL